MVTLFQMDTTPLGACSAFNQKELLHIKAQCLCGLNDIADNFKVE